MWDNKPQKSVVRGLVFQPNKRCQHVIDLPGVDCRSLWNPQKNGMLDVKIIDKNTQLTLIDFNKTYMSQIQRKVKNKFNSCMFHANRFESLDVTTPVDFVNLDTMSSPTKESFEWLFKLPINDQATIACWFTSYRGNKKTEEDLAATILNDDTLRYVHKAMNFYNMVDWRQICPTMRLTLLGLIFTFNHYDFDIHLLERYRDHVNYMYVYCLTNVHKLEKPRFPNLLDIWVDSGYKSMKSKGKRSSLVNGKMSVPEICIAVAEHDLNNAKGYLTLRVRNALKTRLKEGASEKMVRAGWKSVIAKKAFGDVAQKAQLLIDNISLKG